MHKRIAIFGVGVIALIALFSLHTLRIQADDAATWLDGNLNLQKQVEVQSLPTTLNNNVGCSSTTHDGCVVHTMYGFANSGAEVQMNGNNNYYPVFSEIDGQQHFMPIPSSNSAITYTIAPSYGFYLYFETNFSSSVQKIDVGDTSHYQVILPPQARLEDRQHNLLAADYQSVNFSTNGRWMVVSEPNVAMLRVNLDTFQVTPFAPGFDYTIGADPAPMTAISDDGRYAVVASKDFNRAAIYDLDTCGVVPDTISGPVACQSTDFQAPLSRQINGFIGASNFSFIDDDNLSFYAASTNGGSIIRAHYILNDKNSLNQLEYLALGDSYISGEGAFSYLPGTDTDDNHCHISALSYPYLLGHNLNFDSYQSVACSGASTDDITNLSDSYSGQALPHVSRSNLDKSNEVPNIVENFLPGYIDQLDFVKTYQPQIITVSIGGNDIGFSDKLKACLNIATCYDTYEDRLEFVQEVNAKFNTLVDTYQQLKAAGRPDAKVYVIGYPQIAKAGGDCADNIHMNPDELEFAQQAINYLDTVIQQAAARAGVYYVDTQDALDGHRLCEAAAGSVAVNGLTGGNDAPGSLGGPFGNESYHPNEFGHELLENAVLAKTDELKAAMPGAPDASAAPPASTGLDILNVPASGRQVKITEFDPGMTGDTLFKQALNAVNILGPDHGLGASQVLQAQIHSDPVDLGNFTTDASGNLSAQVVIPDSLPAGYHTLHFYGTDVNGQPIDIYKIVYVADSPDDVNGDMIPDNIQAAAAAPPATAVGAAAPPAQSQNVQASSKVLSAQTTTGKPKRHQTPDQSAVILPAAKPNPKILIAAGAGCVWISLCYAAYKFRT